MSASVREQLVRAVVAAIDGSGKPSGLNVHRSRTRAIGNDQLPAVVVYLLQETLPPERQQPARGRQIARRTATLVCECRAKGVLADEALDPLTTWVVQALLADPTLGGLAYAVSEAGTQWDAAELDDVYGGAQVHFQIDYTTAAGDPASRI